MKDKEKNVIVIPSSYMRDYDNNRDGVFKFREEMATKQAIAEDYDLDNIITNDMVISH